MDRLETILNVGCGFSIVKFTFQYGQIRNISISHIVFTNREIYIPVWIDQKLNITEYQALLIFNLHSSMDRLETLVSLTTEIYHKEFTFQYGQIRNLNATVKSPCCIVFTFQYGQIRNERFINNVIKKQLIYIPVWIDQKHISVLMKQQIFSHLHSSMDRLETYLKKHTYKIKFSFTFQYGQIRNCFF